MVLLEEIKNRIEKDYSDWKEYQYRGLTLEQRQLFDQFYTPASITIKMIEAFTCDSLEDKKILDPCCGSGNLLAACLIAGAKPENIYGNEFDEKMLEVCRKRLNALCKTLNINKIPVNNLHQGDATKKRSLINWGQEVKDETCRKEEEVETLQKKQQNMEAEHLW